MVGWTDVSGADYAWASYQSTGAGGADYACASYQLTGLGARCVHSLDPRSSETCQAGYVAIWEVGFWHEFDGLILVKREDTNIRPGYIGYQHLDDGLMLDVQVWMSAGSRDYGYEDGYTSVNLKMEKIRNRNLHGLGRVEAKADTDKTVSRRKCATSTQRVTRHWPY
ncbi:hypothetical protein ACLOJK_029840 [Asimina triloba]